MEKPEDDISKRVVDVKKGIDKLEEQIREQSRLGLLVESYLSGLEKESDVGEKQKLLRNLLATASTKGISSSDVVEVIKLQSGDLALLTLVDEVVGNEE